jgi:GNAT superfamily N-acetyltransferase
VNTGFAVRVASPDDIPDLVTLLVTLFAIEQDFSPDTDRQARGLAGVIANPNGLIAVATDPADKVVGMSSAQMVFSTAEGAWSAWIEDVVVAEPWRGRGLGRALLQYVLDWAASRGATRAQLLVDLDNPPALDFYQHLGWAETRLAARRLSLVRTR